MVRGSPQTRMDTRPRDDQRHLANTLFDYFVQLQLCVYQSISRKDSSVCHPALCHNRVANIVFMSILFGVRSLVFASFDIVVVLVTLFWGMGMIWRYYRWVAIATTLQLVIMQMNVISP